MPSSDRGLKATGVKNFNFPNISLELLFIEKYLKIFTFHFCSLFLGLTHHHRSIVATQKELDAVPKVKVESSHKQEEEILTTISSC